MHDLIGDIHGHASVLKRLLEKLGYQNKAGAYRHPDRTVIFMGDYIDRLPEDKMLLPFTYGCFKGHRTVRH